MKLFTTNRFKLSVFGHSNFEALIFEEYIFARDNPDKADRLKKHNTVFFFVSEYVHSFLILVRNSIDIFEGKSPDIVLFDASEYYNESLSVQFIRKIYSIKDDRKFLFSAGKCPQQKNSTCAVYALTCFLYLARRIGRYPLIIEVDFKYSDSKIFEIFYKMLISIKNLQILNDLRSISCFEGVHFTPVGKDFFAKYGNFQVIAKKLRKKLVEEGIIDVFVEVSAEEKKKQKQELVKDK